MQFDTDASARLGIFDRVGQKINVNLVDTELIREQVFVLKTAHTKIEINVLCLDHRLRDVHEVFRTLDN